MAQWGGSWRRRCGWLLDQSFKCYPIQKFEEKKRLLIGKRSRRSQFHILILKSLLWMHFNFSKRLGILNEDHWIVASLVTLQKSIELTKEQISRSPPGPVSFAFEGWLASLKKLKFVVHYQYNNSRWTVDLLQEIESTQFDGLLYEVVSIIVVRSLSIIIIEN